MSDYPELKFVSKRRAQPVPTPEPDDLDSEVQWRRDAEALMLMGGYVRAADGRLVRPEGRGDATDRL
jgi:hypothetical protein